MKVSALIERLRELDAEDMIVKAPGPAPGSPFPFDGGIIDVTIGTDDQGNEFVFLIPDVSG